MGVKDVSFTGGASVCALAMRGSEGTVLATQSMVAKRVERILFNFPPDGDERECVSCIRFCYVFT